MRKIRKPYKLLVSLDQRHTSRQRVIGGILRWSMIHPNWDVEFACEPLGGHNDLREYLDWGANALIIDESHEGLTDDELLKISGVIAELQANIISLEHNQFISINRNDRVELKITMEAFGTEHKQQIMKALEEHGYRPRLIGRSGSTSMN